MTDIKKIEKNAEKAADFLKGIANHDRLLILCHLSNGELNVTELMEKTGIAQTSMSQHLSKLKKEGIVDFRREHRILHYFITNPCVTKIIEILYSEFCNNKEKCNG